MTIEWSREARRELRAIRAFIARDSVQYADRMVQRIIERVEILLKFPLRGHPVHEYPEVVLRELHEPPYRIIYRVSGDQIEIVTVVHFKHRLSGIRP